MAKLKTAKSFNCQIWDGQNLPRNGKNGQKWPFLTFFPWKGIGLRYQALGLINEKKLTKFILRRIKKVQFESEERAELTEKIFENKSKNQFEQEAHPRTDIDH